MSDEPIQSGPFHGEQTKAVADARKVLTPEQSAVLSDRQILRIAQRVARSMSHADEPAAKALNLMALGPDYVTIHAGGR